MQGRVDQAVRLTDELWQRADSIQGWLSYAEALLLAEYVRSPWCEIGCWKGRSAVILAQSGPGFCVDWFHGMPEHVEEFSTEPVFRESVAGLPVTVIAKKFEDAVDDVPEGLRFLHLDADHSYYGTRRAFELYAPKLEPGGFLVVHDAWWQTGAQQPSAWPDVTIFAHELLGDPEWDHVEDAERSAVFRKL